MSDKAAWEVIVEFLTGWECWYDDGQEKRWRRKSKVKR